MSDPQSRIAAYQRHAEECVAKAQQATDETVRSQYTRLAETYLELADMELRRIELRKPLVLPGD